MIGPSLKELVNRIKFCEKMAANNSEYKEISEKQISKTKEYIVQCVLQNEDNPLLDRITMKEIKP